MLEAPPLHEKRCTGCKTFKPSTEYCKDRTRGDGLQAHCRDCDNGGQRRRDLIAALTEYTNGQGL